MNKGNQPARNQRREILGMLGAGALALCGARPSRAAAGGGSGASMPSCVVTPQQTEGPYFIDEHLRRSDIRTDPSSGVISRGTLLDLQLFVMAASSGGCTPLAGAIVDVWQCDARGVYSGVRDSRFSTIGQQFLRGYQVAGADGGVRFTTVYPGWYRGRAVHIHFKVRTPNDGTPAREFTSQLYFDDRLTDRVHAGAAYGGPDQRRTRNEEDGIFRRGGRELLVPVTEQDGAYAGRFDIGLRLG